MIRLRSQAARRIKAPSICHLCLFSGRSLSTGGIPVHHGPQCQTYRFKGNWSSVELLTGAKRPKETSTSDSSAKENSSGTRLSRRKAEEAKKAGKDGSQKQGPEEKAADASETMKATARQLGVLQGALAALKNVLAEQNINVNEFTKPSESKKKKSSKSVQDAKTKKRSAAKQAKQRKSQGTGIIDARTKEPRKGTPLKALPLDSTTPLGSVTGKPPKPSPNSTKKPLKVLSLVSATPLGGENSTKSTKASRRQKESRLEGMAVSKLLATDIELTPIEKAQPPVPPLAYGLDRVLFNPGVYHLQDPRSKVYNFDPYLAKITPAHEFDFNALKQYITSSKDEALIGITREHGKRFTGSTSSMTSMLSHFHYLLSAWRDINSSMMSQAFELPSLQFTRIMKAPAAIFLRWKDGVYAIDADKEFDTANVLSMMGKSMEKLLTLPREEYERYLRENLHEITEEERNADESYHYTSAGDFMMRSQLDAHDPRIPGTGMFDLKTRAVLSIRMDAKGYEKGVPYELRKRHGNWESFEREYHDMIRAAFLKYSLQVRMGRMDGIFVAYHNTARIFGFQYIPLEEMDLSLHGTSNLTLGHNEFKLSLGLLNTLLNRATEKFPEKSLRLHFETRQSQIAPFMYIFVEPMEPSQIEEIQGANRAAIEEFERRVLKMVADEEVEIDSTSIETAVDADDVVVEAEEEDLDEVDGSSAVEMQDATTWDEVKTMVEDAMNDDEIGVGVIREAIEDALEQSGLIQVQSPEQARRYVDALLSAITGGPVSAVPDKSGECLGDEVPTSSEHVTEEVREVTGGEAGEIDFKVDDQPVAEDPEQSEPSQELEEEQKSESQDVDVTEESDSLVAIDSVAPGQSEVSEGLEGDESEMDDEEKSLEEGKSKDETAPTSNMSALKTMIMRMAEKMDENKIAHEDDGAKLHEFERILGNMIALSNKTSLEGSGQPIVPSTVQDAVEETEESPGKKQKPPQKEKRGEVLGMVLTIRNKVNGKYVTRPLHLTEKDEWEVEYNIDVLDDARAWTLYQSCQKRRQNTFVQETSKDDEWYRSFGGRLAKVTEKGRRFREREDKLARQRPVYVLGEDGSRTYEEVFGHVKDDDQGHDAEKVEPDFEEDHTHM